VCSQVTDNVGVDAQQVTSSPPRSHQFSVDTTSPVIYTAVDRAGLQSSCTFNVQVKRQGAAQYLFKPFSLSLTLALFSYLFIIAHRKPSEH